MASSVALTPTAEITREWLNNNQALTSYQSNKVLYAKTELSALALKSEVDTVQADADKANTTIGDWETDHPGQTISQCATSQETELAEHAGSIAQNQADITTLQGQMKKAVIRPDVVYAVILGVQLTISDDGNHATAQTYSFYSPLIPDGTYELSVFNPRITVVSSEKAVANILSPSGEITFRNGFATYTENQIMDISSCRPSTTESGKFNVSAFVEPPIAQTIHLNR